MTPEQLITRGQECQRLKEKLSILQTDDCYLIVGKENIFFRTNSSEGLTPTEEQREILRTVSNMVKHKMISSLQQQMEELTNDTGTA